MQPQDRCFSILKCFQAIYTYLDDSYLLLILFGRIKCHREILNSFDVIKKKLAAAAGVEWAVFLVFYFFFFLIHGSWTFE